MALHVPSFGGGVALEGAADTRRVDEVELANSFDLGPRGALVAASDFTDYVTLNDGLGNPWSKVHHLAPFVGSNFSKVLAIGEGLVAGPLLKYVASVFARVANATPVALGAVLEPPGVPVTPQTEGCVVTVAPFPGVFTINNTAGVPPNIFCTISLFCIGAREGFPPNAAASQSFGLWVAAAFPPATGLVTFQIVRVDALGTGPFGELPVGGGAAGTQSKQLFARGVLVYNNHAMCWGFDSHDTVAGDGPARVMFSNLGNPLKWGNDNLGNVGTDRAFTDSDAIVLGGAGEIIRAGIVWAGKAVFGTDKGLHYVGGYGRDSFLTDGFTPVDRAFNVTGPHAMIEGPDKLLYGCSERGLWRLASLEQVPEPLFLKLIDQDGHSNRYWDLIWTDVSRGITYPGRTNQDLVWLAVDREKHQVIVGIPWCDFASGAGYGLDTVVLKFHTRTGGFTRQVFSGIQLTAAGYFTTVGQTPATSFGGTGTAGKVSVQRYGYKATPLSAPVMPTNLPDCRLGPYAPFGPDGVGTIRRVYLTLSWESGALPIVLAMTSQLDEATVDVFNLIISATAPGGPVDGTLWLDTAQNDPNLGNLTAGAITPALGGYLLKTWFHAGWQYVAGKQVFKGTRVSIPMPTTRRDGTRLTWQCACSVSAGRYQLEGFGINPGDAQEEA